MEQRAALAAGRRLDRSGPVAPGRAVPGLLGNSSAPRAESPRPRDPARSRPRPRATIPALVEPRQIAAHREPERLRLEAHDVVRGQPLAHILEREQRQRAMSQRREIRRIEARRIARDMSEIEMRRELLQRTHRAHRFRRAGQRRERRDGQRLVALLAQRGDRQRAGALRQPFAGAGDQEIVMREDGRRRSGASASNSCSCTAVLVT